MSKLTSEEFVLATLDEKFPRDEKPLDTCRNCGKLVQIMINRNEHVCSEKCRKELVK